MKVGKPKSKRVPVRLRHKIEKASAAKQRKQRKEAKKNPQWRSRLKKDPGIPNLFPYKDKLLAEIEESKRRKEEEAQKRREIAKAQRQGTAVNEKTAPVAEDEDAELLDPDAEEEEVEGMDVQDDSNPMAALLASAQARAQAYSKDDEDDDEDDEDDEEEEWDGVEQATKPAPGQSSRKALPKQALADPVKAVSALMERMQKTQDGIQRLIEHYNLPPLVTAGGDMTSRFLVEVARKRGRLGRGGVPNLNAAALTVLGDLNEERLVLPAVESVEKKKVEAGGKSEVHVVATMAPAFRIEGLFGDQEDAGGDAMAVEA
jgi:nuclear GTP-binding protein